MAFQEVGTFMAMITEVCASEPKFANNAGPDDYDINILLVKEDNNAEADWWRGEMSQNFGKGNVKHLTQSQLTGKTLAKLGFTGGDLSQLPAQLEGKLVPVTTRASEDGKYINIHYIGGEAAPAKIDFATAQAKSKAQKAGQAAAPSMPAAAAPAPAHVPEATVESCQPSKAAAAAATDPFAIPPTTAAPAAAAPAAVETQEGDIPADDDLPF